MVKGRITIEDQVIEKIAALAAMEVQGVATSSARTSPPSPSETPPGLPGAPAAPDGPRVRVHLHDNEVSLDLSVAVEYGCVVMDVAKEVKAHVARMVGQMLGMRVVAVNVSVEDVSMPAGGRPARAPGGTPGGARPGARPGSA
ncbi:Asp23/Gls24 family envelope stress response protein [Actinomadura viridis]|uniref:Alkaline shock family protein YloU n=1 Tax=Actinomadura viridis TaxID=58110 RepID=A0A931GP64_9ACTN|nr:Asp23/Gls24 family envelope stress response protein [Actinomadura viridis]MBG6090276.1 putative alkaline shock family protein YloU [Actinomadura viridis]